MLSIDFDFLFYTIFWFVVLCLFISPLWGYYGFLKLVERDIVWTRVEQGWEKIVLKWGKYHRKLKPGLRLIGFPGIHTLYSRKMTFFKSVTDESGNAKALPHNEANISSFKTTRYPYALPFKDEEDSHGLNLSGLLAVFAIIVDYQKAFFLVSDWYSEMNTKILSRFRELLVEISYDDDIVGRDTTEEQSRKTINTRLWEALNFKQNGSLSILEELEATAGIKVELVELVSVDPPAGWRDITLAPYKADREKEAAKKQAEASAILFDDTNQALKAWLKENPNATPEQIRAKQDELRDRALAKTPGYQQVHIKGLENASTAVVGGGGNTGILVGGNKKGGK